VADRTYTLEPDRPLAAEVRRVARGRLSHALDELRGAGTDRDEAVHEARKDLKKLRSLLRLVRAEIGDEAYRTENRRLRDAGRRLSGVRDAQVVVEALDGLAGREEAGAYRGLREVLEARRSSVEQDRGAREDAVAALEQALRRVADWPLERDGWEALEPGLRRQYRRGRRAMRAALEDPTTEALHEWRKRAKDLWYHLRLLRGAFPAPLDAAAQEAHLLSDHLGDDHDLAVLLETARGLPEALGGPRGLAAFEAALGRRRAELQAEAFALGRRMYAEPAGAFVKRMGAYWRAARPAVRA
jgi:CHAD domain-containing protein